MKCAVSSVGGGETVWETVEPFTHGNELLATEKSWLFSKI